MENKKFEIWVEGYRATGEHGTAQLIDIVEADTFDNACLKAHWNMGKGERLIDSLDRDNKKPDGFRRGGSGNYSIWACNLYDNEEDARKSFG